MMLEDPWCLLEGEQNQPAYIHVPHRLMIFIGTFFPLFYVYFLN